MKFLERQIRTISKIFIASSEEEVKTLLPNTCIEINSILPLKNNRYLVRFKAYSNITYEDLVNKLIAEKYTIQDELAIQRKHQKGINIDEFNEYDAYVESCKAKAKAFIAERDEALNNG